MKLLPVKVTRRAWGSWGRNLINIYKHLSSEGIRGDGHKMKYRKFHLNIRKNFFLWRCSDVGTGCPESLWSLCPWRHSKPDWTMRKQPALPDPAWIRQSPEVPSGFSCLVILLTTGKSGKNKFRKQYTQKSCKHAFKQVLRGKKKKKSFLFSTSDIFLLFFFNYFMISEVCIQTTLHSSVP